MAKTKEKKIQPWVLKHGLGNGVGCILGGGNMQKGPGGLGQKIGSKVENSENLEFYFLTFGDHMFLS